MAASVAYPVGSLLEDELRRPRTPRLKTGSNNGRPYDTHDVCDLEFMLACIHVQCAISNRDVKRSLLREVENTRSAQQPVPFEKSFWIPPILLTGPPPPPYGETTPDSPPDYTNTDSSALCQTPETDLPPQYVPCVARRADTLSGPDSLLTPRVDFSSLHNIRTHGKKKKGNAKAAAPPPEKKEEPKEEEKADEGNGGTGGGGDGGAGDNGNDGEDWGDDGWDKKDDKKGKKLTKKQQEEEDKKKEEEAKKKAEEEAAAANDGWGDADNGWGSFGSGKKGKKTKEKAEEETVAASTNAWADSSAAPEKDDGFGFLAGTGLGAGKKKGKKTKTPAEDAAPATEGFQDINLMDEQDPSVPKISLSFEEEAAVTKEKESTSLGLGSWGTSWSFGALGGAKKEEEKPKSPAGWVKSTFSDFNFGFGGGGGSGGEAKGASKKYEDDEDNLLPSWGSAGIGLAAKKEKKSSVFGGIDEVDDVKEDNWGGWNSKKDDDKETATKSWDTWGSSTKSDKKMSWGNFDEVGEEKIDPLPAVKEDEDAGGWGSFGGTSKSKLKKGKVTGDETASKTAPKEDVWGWAAKDGKDKTADKKDDDDWGEFTSTAIDKKEQTASGGSPPLSILKGLAVLADGRIENLLGDTVGELIEEDMVQAKKCSRMMFLCDEEGKIRNSKGKIIASAKTIGPASEPEAPPVIESPETELLVEVPEQAELPDIAILDGLRVEEDGKILNSEGVPIGELIEGDAKAINKKKIASNTRGEFRDKKWRLLGQAQVLPVAQEAVPDETPEPAQITEEIIPEETQEPELPDVSTLEGLKLESDGKVLNHDGVAIGELVEGDPALIVRRKYTCTAQGTFLDKKLKVVGHCRTLPIFTPGAPEPEKEQEPEPVPDPPAEPEISFETPDISILKGQPCEKDGRIMSIEGVAIGELIEGDAKVIAKKFILCDAEGQFKAGKKIFGKARVIPQEIIKAPDPIEAEEVPEAEKVEEAGCGDLPPLSILNNLNVEADGTILSADKVVIGRVVQGDAAKFATMMYYCDAEGNVVTYTGKPIGKVETVAAAGSPASKNEPVEDIKDDQPIDEPAVQEAPTEPPPLSILKGCAVEADGSVLDTDGNVIGQVTEGDAKRFQLMGYKCDGEGNVLSKKKKVGKVKTVLPEVQPAADEPVVEEDPAVETVEEVVPEATSDVIEETVSLEILNGRLIEASGEIFDDDSNLIGRLIEGDAKKINKAKAKCDADGNVVDKKGKQIGKVEVVQPEKVEPPVIPDEVDEVVEVAAPEVVVDEPVSVEILNGRTIEVTGEIFDDDYKLIGKLIEGDAKKLNKNKAKCDAVGNVLDKKGKIVGKAEVIQPEKIEAPDVVDVPEEPENVGEVEESKEEEIVAAPPEPVSLEILKGRTIEASGDVLDDDMNVIGRLVDGNAKKLNKAQAKCDGDGNVMMKNKVSGKVEVIQPEIPETPEEPAKEEEESIETPEAAVETPAASAPLTLASLENLSLDDVGDVYTNDGVLVGRLVEGSGNAKRLYAKFAYCDAEGNVWADDVKVKGRVEVIPPETPADELPQPDDSQEPEQPAPKTITLEDLEGRTIELNGDILDDDGQIIGKLVKGKADKLFKAKAKCDDNGGVFHKDKKCGNVEVVQPSIPEAPKEEAIEEVIPPPPPVPEEVAEPEPEKPEPPTFALVDGRKIEKNGDVLDDDGNVIAKLSQGSGSKLNKAGATCRADGTIWAKMKQVKEAALELILPEVPEETVPEMAVPEVEDPAPPSPPEQEVIEEEAVPKAEPPSFASLAGIKVDKFGEFLNADNVVVARLATGSISKLYKAGATCDAEGKVWAKGKLDKIATVEMVFVEKPEAPEPPGASEELPAPPADDAVPEAEPETAKVSKWAQLDGLRIDKYGDIRNGNMDVIAKLVKGTGDAKKLAKEKATCDGEGNLVVKGAVVKDAKIALEPAFDEDEEIVEPPPPEPEVVDAETIPEPEMESEAPTSKYAKLEGLKIDGFGEVMDINWEVVAKLVSGNAAKLAKQGATIDAEGNVVVKGKIVKDAKIELEGVEEEARETEEVTEETAPEIEPVPVPEPETVAEPPQPDFSKAEGLKIDRYGDVMDKSSSLVAKLVEGDAKKLAKDKAMCDANGNVLVKGKIVKGARIEMQISEEVPPEIEEPVTEEAAVEEAVIEDPPAEPEIPPGPSFATIEGKKIDRFGDIFDDDNNVIAALIEGDAAKLSTRGAVCGPNGTVIAKGKTVKNARVELKAPADPEPEPEIIEEPAVEAIEEEKEDLSRFAKLEGLRIDKAGEVWDKGWNLVAKLAEGNAAKLAKDKAVCDGEGNLLVKGSVVDGAKVKLIEETGVDDTPAPVEEDVAVPEPPVLTLASLEGKQLEADGTILDDDGKIIGKLVEGVAKLAVLRKAKAKCDAEGNVIAKSKVVPKCKVEVVMPEPEEPAAVTEPEATKEFDDWLGDDWGAPKKDKEVKKGTVASRLAAFENPDSLSKTSGKTKAKAMDWGSSWDTPADRKVEEEPAKEESGWGASFGWGSSSKKKTEDTIDDSKIMKAAVEEPKSDDNKDTSGFAFLNKKDKKKKASKNAPVEVVDDVLDVPLHESANVEETKSNVEEDPDWAFASNRVKAKKGKKGASAGNEDDAFFRAPSPPEEDVMKAIEAPPETKKSKKSKKKATSDEADLSKSITKTSDKSQDLIDIGEGENDDLAPDDSASVTKEPKEAPVGEKKEEKKSGGWGAMFGFGAPAKPTLAQLRKEREERERKDKEERESVEQQEREENERLERERIEEEKIEQERLEQEERDKALEEAEKAKKEEENMYVSTTKKSKKGSKKSGKGKAVEIPPPPPPPPVQAAESSLSKSSAKNVPEEDELLPALTDNLKSASASTTKGIKSSSSKTKSLSTAGLSVAERIKALKGETKLKEAAALLTPPVPPPPPAPPVEAEIEASPSKDQEIVALESSTKKSSKKHTSSSKSAKHTSKKKAPVPVLEKKESKTQAPGGFPGSDEDSELEPEQPEEPAVVDAPEPVPAEEPVVDLAPPTPPPETDMGAKATTKSSRKSALDKKSAKSKGTSKSSKAPKAVAKKVIDTSTESESETEVEQEKAAVNAEGTQGSGSTTAVDSQAERKIPTPPPDTKTPSPAKKERAKVVRSSTGGSAWGLWGVSTPKQIRDRAKQAASVPVPKASAKAKPMMVRERPARKESVSASAAASGGESEKKASSSKAARPVPKRAPTFSLFGSAPTPRKAVRSSGTPRSRPSSRPQSRRASPTRTDGTKTEGDEEVVRVSSKAAKVMGIRARGGPSASRRVKSKGAPDPYAIDDEPVMVDNGLDTYAESSPVAAKKSKRKSVVEATSSTNDDGLLVDVDASEGTRGAAADFQERPSGTRSRKPSPSKRRSQSRHNPRTSTGGIMGLFSGLSRSKTVREPRTSDPAFSSSRSKRDGYGSEDGSGNKGKRMSGAIDDSSEPRQHRRRKSRRDTAVDDDGFVTDAPGATTDFEEADRQRAERKAARREERRNVEDARASEERATRRRERDIEKERDREARRIARAEQIRQEEEARRREEKDARRAARRARDEERIREEEQARLDEQERIEKEDRRARRRAQREKERDRDIPRDSEREDRPQNRRRSSHMDSKRTPGDRSRRISTKTVPIENYFDPRNAAHHSSLATPYLGSDKDKTSSWVESLSKETPLPLAPEDTATVIEPNPGDDQHSTDEEETRRKMQQRSSRRRGDEYRGSNRERGDRPRERERRRKVRTSDSGDEKQRRRRSAYLDGAGEEGPTPRLARRNTGMEVGGGGGGGGGGGEERERERERPGQTKRASWFKKFL